MDLSSQVFQQSGEGITLVFEPHWRYKIPKETLLISGGDKYTG